MESHLDHEIEIPLPRSGEMRRVSCSICREKAISELMESANLPARFAGLSLSELDPSPAVEAAIEYVNDYPTRSRDGKGPLIAGPVGTVKTQLAVSVGMELIRRHLVRVEYVTVTGFLEEARDFDGGERRRENAPS